MSTAVIATSRAEPHDSGGASAVLAREPKVPRRFVELDALRGVAAMMVVFYHFSIFTAANPHGRIMFYLHPVLAGHEAVVLFFLLSGFVLSLSTWKGSTLTYKDYIVRRVCRIYVPYLAALALSVLGCALFWEPAGRGIPVRDGLWEAPPTLSAIVQHTAFLGVYDGHFNGAFWSLIVEMRVSIIFPFVCWALFRMRTWVGLAAALTLSACAIWISANHPDNTMANWAATVQYLAFFILGALLARRLSRQPCRPFLESSVMP